MGSLVSGDVYSAEVGTSVGKLDGSGTGSDEGAEMTAALVPGWAAASVPGRKVVGAWVSVSG